MKIDTTAKLLVLAAYAACSLSATASTYQVSQSGFAAGGIVTGTFSGADVNHDGVIASFSGEINSFQLHFSGSELIPSFNYGLPELMGLVYEVGTAFIGDSSGPIPFGEGLIAGPVFLPAGYKYNTGLLPIVSRGAAIFSPQGDIVDSTTQLLAVSAVPELASEWLFGFGAFFTLAVTRRRSA